MAHATATPMPPADQAEPLEEAMGGTLGEGLGGALRRVGRKRRRFAGAAALAWAAAWWLVAAGCVILVDAASPWSATARAAAGAALLVLWPALLWRAWSERRPPWRRGVGRAGAGGEMLGDARVIEQHHALNDNPLVTGVQVGPSRAVAETGGAGLADPFVAALIDRSQRRGRAALAEADAEVVVDRRALRRGAAWLGLAAAGWAAAGAIWPHLMIGGVLRLAQPYAAHPPFSLTRVAVQATPPRPTVGEDVVVRATLSGRVVDRAWVVRLEAGDRRGGESAMRGGGDRPGRRWKAGERWPMRRVGRGRFTFTLARLREPTVVRVEAGGGRSPVLRIQPHVPESESDGRSAGGAHGGVAEGSQTSPKRRERAGARGGGDSAAEAESKQPAASASGLARRLRALEARAAEIVRRAAALSKKAGASGKGGEAGGAREGSRQSARAAARDDARSELDARVGRFQAAATALAQNLRRGAPSAGVGRRGKVARKLEALALAQRGVATGHESGGRSAGSGTPAPPARIAAAARADAATLAGMVTRAEGKKGAIDSPGASAARAASGSGGATASGVRRERVHSENADAPRSEAIIRQAPPAYQNLVRRYFDRLNRDQNRSSNGPR